MIDSAGTQSGGCIVIKIFDACSDARLVFCLSSSMIKETSILVNVHGKRVGKSFDTLVRRAYRGRDDKGIQDQRESLGFTRTGC